MKNFELYISLRMWLLCRYYLSQMVRAKKNW